MDSSTARVRFWVVAPATSSPSGRRFNVNDDRFAAELSTATASLKVAVPDRLGPGPERTFDLTLGKLRGLQVGSLPSASPLLKSLQSLAESPGSPESAAARVRELCGDGPLAAAVADAARDPAPPASSGGGPVTADSLGI